MVRVIRLAGPAGSAETEGEIFLPPDQARHGALVIRLKVGSPVEITGPFGLAPALVTTCEPAGPRLGVRLTGPWSGRVEPPGPRLALALIQNQRFDWALEKAVELGASALIPLLCERVKKGLAQAAAFRAERWRRLAEEARKQCGRPVPLAVLAPIGIPELVRLPGPAFFLEPSGPAPVRPLRAENPPLVAIGPEGGFSPAEIAALLTAGFSPWGLGPGILRAETAALAALAVLL
jgi:16S rRNA (uracil1498-N3)-methyltransferase